MKRTAARRAERRRLVALAGLALACLALAGCDGDDAVTAPPPDAGPDAAEASDVPCPANGVGKGPWSLAMTGTSVTVRWEACRPGTAAGLSFHPEAGGADVRATSVESPVTLTERHEAPLNANKSPADAPGTYYTHEAKLEGLTPGTCYRYALDVDGALGGRFCTSRPAGQKVHFMAIGDTNPLLGPATTDVLSHLLPLAPDFIVHGGDIQYYNSGLETWAGWFPVMQPLLSAGAMQPALGNHEHEKDDELDGYSKRFFFDTAAPDDRLFYRFESGGVYFHMLDTEQPLELTSPQGQWLAESLKDAAAQPGFVLSVLVMHRPLVTCGDTNDNEPVRKAYAPLLAQYHVPLVIQAHMHGYERFDLDGVTYVTSGGGGGLLSDTDQNASRATCASRKSSGSFFHALDVVIEGGTIKGACIDDQGATRDTFTIPAP